VAKASREKPARRRVGERVDVAIAVKTPDRAAAEIDHRQCVGIAEPVDRVAEITEPDRHVLGPDLYDGEHMGGRRRSFCRNWIAEALVPRNRGRISKLGPDSLVKNAGQCHVAFQRAG